MTAYPSKLGKFLCVYSCIIALYMNVFCSRISGVEVLDCTPGVLYRKVRKHAVFLKVYLSGLQIVSVEEDHEAVEARVSRASANVFICRYKVSEWPTTSIACQYPCKSILGATSANLPGTEDTVIK